MNAEALLAFALRQLHGKLKAQSDEAYEESRRLRAEADADSGRVSSEEIERAWADGHTAGYELGYSEARHSSLRNAAEELEALAKVVVDS